MAGGAFPVAMVLIVGRSPWPSEDNQLTAAPASVRVGVGAPQSPTLLHIRIRRPGLGDYRVALVPIEEGRPPPPTGWALDRPSFRELLWLEEH